MNEHWPRWIFASITKHFDAYKGSYPMYIEGQNRNDRTEDDLFEVRVDGPYFTEVSKGYWHIVVEVSILVQSAIKDGGFHDIHKMVGKMASAFQPIRVFRYGTGSDDDGTQLGCLQLIADLSRRERIEISHFGQLQPALRITQATVEGHYGMQITE